MSETEARDCVIWAVRDLGQAENPSAPPWSRAQLRVGGDGTPRALPLPVLSEATGPLERFLCTGRRRVGPSAQTEVCLPTHLGSWLWHPTWVGGVGMCVKGNFSCHCSSLVSYNFTSLPAAPEAHFGLNLEAPFCPGKAFLCGCFSVGTH